MIIKYLSTSSWRQNDRLLVLCTPAGEDVLLAEAVQWRETLGPVAGHAGYLADLTALSSDAHLPLTGLLGQPVRLDLQTGLSRSERRPLHGHVTRITRVGANGGFGRYRLTIEPWLAFLDQRRDSYVFRDRSVFEIVDQVFGNWQGQGRLVPAWRWEVADRARYPRRSITTQYRETDLAFLRRLLVEEGLFCWFEHAADDDATLGSHTLVIADHNGAFQDNPQPNVRFTQAGATLAGDSLDRWQCLRRLDSTHSAAVSWDYRSRGTRPQASATRVDNGAQAPRVEALDDPGQYAWESGAQGERRIDNHRQAVDARTETFLAEGTVRSAAPGSLFRLDDHAGHAGDVEDERRFLITSVVHQARNNLNERVPDAVAALGPAPGVFDLDWSDPGTRVEHYRNRLTAVRAGVPWRPLCRDGQGRFLHPKPTVQGAQTAIVVGDGAPTHTDRDHRVRIQFHWQRGSNPAHRLPHPHGADNAPASAALGTWVRVATPVAGANWGGHLVPRPGQEVLVAFLHGDIDRPVVVGALYNGAGQDDAAGNRCGAGGSLASGNAPAWFAGQQGPHAHSAALSGLKTQALQHSRSGRGDFNQLVFDDAPGEARIELGTTAYATRLQLGHLAEQQDNARLAARGHGAELATTASAAVRAGSGLLVSADARPAAQGSHLDSREPIAQTEQALQLTTTLAEAATAQSAALPGDPAARELPAGQGYARAVEALKATATAGEPASPGRGDFKATGGGDGTVPAWHEPRLQFAAPGGIAQLTPADAVLVAGRTWSIATGQDTNLVTQSNQAVAIRDGLALFTVGKAPGGAKPNTETGIHLHAASGRVSVQAQSDEARIAAEGKVTLASTHATTRVAARGHLLATAQGAYLKLEGGDIQLHAQGQVLLEASQKNLAGPRSAAASTRSPAVSALGDCATALAETAACGASGI